MRVEKINGIYWEQLKSVYYKSVNIGSCQSKALEMGYGGGERGLIMG